MSLTTLGGRVQWRHVPGKGRGVFALLPAKAGDVLECSPVTVVSDADFLEAEPHENRLHQYIFYWSDEPGRESALGWGFLSLYNHSSDPNIEIDGSDEPDTLAVRALRDIAEGEELCFDYGDIWFEPVA